MRIRELGVTHHTFRPLEAAGFTDVDQLGDLTIEQISEYVPSGRALAGLADKLGRSEEYQHFIGKYTIPVSLADGTVTEVEAGKCRQLAGLNGTASHFGFQEVRDLKNALREGSRMVGGVKQPFSLADIARYKVEHEAEKEATAEAEGEESEFLKALDGAGNLDAGAEADREVLRLVGLYATDYDKHLFLQTDWEDINRLASLEYFVNSSQRTLSRLSPDQRLKYATQLIALQEQVTRGLAEIRRQKDALKVSLTTRNLDEKQKEGHQVVTDLIRDAKEMIREQCSVAVHCGIRQGMALVPFPRNLPQKTLQLRCIRCGELFEWELVSEQQLDFYVEADDFMPEGAPEGIFQRQDGPPPAPNSAKKRVPATLERKPR